jgi:5-(carboxyamino)imidazole ribonucleotide synthase
MEQRAIHIDRSKRRFCVGIIGGGQLARMSAYAAYRLGFNVAVLDKDPHAPACKVTPFSTIGWVTDEETVAAFARECDVITLENEFVDAHRLEAFERLGVRVAPSSSTLAMLQDKLVQKRTLAGAGIPVPAFAGVDSVHDAEQAASWMHYPLLLKSRKMGYDGHGNATVRTGRELHEAVARLGAGHAHLLAERFVRFRMELAVMVARTDRETVVYPVVQTVQRDHICHTVFAPARIEPHHRARAEEIAVASVRAVQGTGIFGVELFLTENGDILVNEMAPRPHNSGHYSIDACTTSQFENHIRAVCGLPLGSPAMRAPAAVMVNLLGRRAGAAIATPPEVSLSDPDLHLHLYGKEYTREGRKMGHITMVGLRHDILLKRALRVEQSLLV